MDRWEQFNSIVENENIDLKEKGLLLILFRYINNKTNYASPSRALIKKLTGITDNRTLDNIINSLIEKGLIDRVSGKGVRSKYYIKVGGKITPSVEITPSVKITPGVGVKITPTVGVKITPQKEKKRKIKENIIYIDLSFIDDIGTENVKLTENQYNDLCSKYNNDLVNNKILDFNLWLLENNSKDHYRHLNNWCSKDIRKVTKKSSNAAIKKDFEKRNAPRPNFD